MNAGPVPAALRSSHENVLASVFPRPVFNTPTAENTPTIGSLSSPGRAFGGFAVVDPVADATIKINRAWSVATRYLSVGLDSEVEATQHSQPSKDIRDAVYHLLRSPDSRKDLSVWYTNGIRVHFQTLVRPALEIWQHPVAGSKAPEILDDTIVLLYNAQRHYLGAIESLIAQADQEQTLNLLASFLEQVKSDLHALVVFSLPHQRLQRTIASALYQHMSSSLQESQDRAACTRDKCRCSIDLDKIPLAQMHAVGLGSRHGERAFAHAVDKLLRGPAIERRCFGVDWTGHEHITGKLQTWIKEWFCPFIQKSLSTITGKDLLEISTVDEKQYLSVAISNLGSLRISALFNYVKAWPESQGAILDIKEYLQNGDTGTKARVCAAFIDQVSSRLLHSGASTTEILSIYINVIHAFRTLDARGVLFEKVAAPIRSYLRGRDDTVSIIAASFLVEAGPDAVPKDVDPETVCLDIPLEVNRSAMEARRDNQMSNWNDMDWMPDPIDAGPDYKATRTDDIVAYILSLFDQEDLINEVRNVLATHLLDARDPEYTKETRLVELLKARLDPNKLQAVEVMLKDVRDSVIINRRINPAARDPAVSVPTPMEVRAAIPAEGITVPSLYRIFEKRIKHGQFLAILNTVATKRRDLLFQKRTRARPEPPREDPVGGAGARNDGIEDFQVQIISKSFWPEMSTDEFTLPANLQRAQDRFTQAFANQGSQRKLQFRPALGRTTVELALEDRTIKEVNVQAWKASVIAAFSTAERDPADIVVDVDDAAPIELSLEQLTDALQMDAELVQSALHFWVTKRVLYEPSPGMYAVLERLDMDVGIAVVPSAIGVDGVSAIKSQDAMLRESAPVFSTFIANMLRNGGPKEVDGMMGITNMLKMVLPIFTYGEDEVRWLLGEMEARGEVTRNGEVWSAT